MMNKFKLSVLTIFLDQRNNLRDFIFKHII